MVPNTYNNSTQKAEVGRSQVQDQPLDILNKFILTPRKFHFETIPK